MIGEVEKLAQGAVCVLARGWTLGPLHWTKTAYRAKLLSNTKGKKNDARTKMELAITEQLKQLGRVGRDDI